MKERGKRKGGSYRHFFRSGIDTCAKCLICHVSGWTPLSVDNFVDILKAKRLRAAPGLLPGGDAVRAGV